MKNNETTGSIARAAQILGKLSLFDNGASLTQLVAETGMTKSTTHRVLGQLIAENYVSFDQVSKRYRLGTALVQIAAQAKLIDWASVASMIMKRVSSETEDTVYMFVPDGNIVVCVAREVGTYPIQALGMEVGGQLPIGVGAAGRVAYSLLSDKHREAMRQVNAELVKPYNISEDMLEGFYVDYHRRGYALTPSPVVGGATAVGLPLLLKDGSLVGILTLGAVSDRMSEERLETKIVPTMRREITGLVERIDLLRQEGLY